MHRALRTRMNEEALRELLQSLFVSELLARSRRLWLVSPWVSRVPVIDNTAGQFRSLVPNWESRSISLDEVLLELVQRGSVVTVATRPDPKNEPFMRCMESARQALPHMIHLFENEELHEKGLLTDHFYLAGSFNFTISGITKSQEVATLERSPDRISEAAIALCQRWKA